MNCEILQDKCVGIQCLNGGRCVNNGTNLTCICSKGFHGENCELIIDYCQSQPVRKRKNKRIERDFFSSV